MSEEAAFATEDSTREVFVRLLDEGTDAWRPTRAEPGVGDTFLLLATEDDDPDDESWEFPPASTVECRRQPLGGRDVLVACRPTSARATQKSSPS